MILYHHIVDRVEFLNISYHGSILPTKEPLSELGNWATKYRLIRPQSSAEFGASLRFPTSET